MSLGLLEPKKNTTDLQSTHTFRLGMRAARTLQKHIKKGTLWCAWLTNALASVAASSARIARSLDMCFPLCLWRAHGSSRSGRTSTLISAHNSFVACAWQLAHCMHLDEWRGTGSSESWQGANNKHSLRFECFKGEWNECGLPANL